MVSVVACSVDKNTSLFNVGGSIAVVRPAWALRPKPRSSFSIELDELSIKKQGMPGLTSTDEPLNVGRRKIASAIVFLIPFLYRTVKSNSSSNNLHLAKQPLGSLIVSSQRNGWWSM